MHELASDHAGHSYKRSKEWNINLVSTVQRAFCVRSHVKICSFAGFALNPFYNIFPLRVDLHVKHCACTKEH